MSLGPQTDPSSARERAHEAAKAVGRRLRLIRLQRGLTQEEAARRLGISYQQIQKWEAGHNRLHVGWVGSICQVYGCSPADLLTEDPPAPAAHSRPAGNARRLASGRA